MVFRNHHGLGKLCVRPSFIENVGQFDAGARFSMWGCSGNYLVDEDVIWHLMSSER